MYRTRVFFILLTLWMLSGCTDSHSDIAKTLDEEMPIVSSSVIDDLDITSTECADIDTAPAPIYTQMDEMVTLQPTGAFPSHCIQNGDTVIQFMENQEAIQLTHYQRKESEILTYSELINDQLIGTSLSFNMISLYSTIYFYQNQEYVYFFFEGSGGSDIPCIVVLRLYLSEQKLDQCHVYPNSALHTVAADEGTFYIIGQSNPLAGGYPASQSFISLLNKETLEEYQLF